MDFTAWQSSSYDVYLIIADGLIPTTNGDPIGIRFNTGGGFDSGSNYRFMYSVGTESAFTTTANSTSATSIQIGLSTNASGATGGMNFAAYLYGANSATRHKRLRVEGDQMNSGDSNFYYIGGFGRYAVATALTQFQVITGSGHTIASGVVYVYGLVKT